MTTWVKQGATKETARAALSKKHLCWESHVHNSVYCFRGIWLKTVLQWELKGQKPISLTLLTVLQKSGCAVGEVESYGYGLGLAKSSQRHQQAVSPKSSKARKDKQINRWQSVMFDTSYEKIVSSICSCGYYSVLSCLWINTLCALCNSLHYAKVKLHSLQWTAYRHCLNCLSPI